MSGDPPHVQELRRGGRLSWHCVSLSVTSDLTTCAGPRSRECISPAAWPPGRTHCPLGRASRGRLGRVCVRAAPGHALGRPRSHGGMWVQLHALGRCGWARPGAGQSSGRNSPGFCVVLGNRPTFQISVARPKTLSVKPQKFKLFCPVQEPRSTRVPLSPNHSHRQSPAGMLPAPRAPCAPQPSPGRPHPRGDGGRTRFGPAGRMAQLHADDVTVLNVEVKARCE